MSHLEQTNVLAALNAGAEIDAFLGNVVEIAIVTRAEAGDRPVAGVHLQPGKHAKPDLPR